MSIQAMLTEAAIKGIKTSVTKECTALASIAIRKGVQVTGRFLSHHLAPSEVARKVRHAKINAIMLLV